MKWHVLVLNRPGVTEGWLDLVLALLNVIFAIILIVGVRQVSILQSILPSVDMKCLRYREVNEIAMRIPDMHEILKCNLLYPVSPTPGVGVGVGCCLERDFGHRVGRPLRHRHPVLRRRYHHWGDLCHSSLLRGGGALLRPDRKSSLGVFWFDFMNGINW